MHLRWCLTNYILRTEFLKIIDNNKAVLKLADADKNIIIIFNAECLEIAFKRVVADFGGCDKMRIFLYQIFVAVNKHNLIAHIAQIGCQMSAESTGADN